MLFRERKTLDRHRRSPRGRKRGHSDREGHTDRWRSPERSRRNAEILLKAGRLAAEYLISKGELELDSSRFKRTGVNEKKESKENKKNMEYCSKNGNSGYESDYRKKRGNADTDDRDKYNRNRERNRCRNSSRKWYSRDGFEMEGESGSEMENYRDWNRRRKWNKLKDQEINYDSDRVIREKLNYDCDDKADGLKHGRKLQRLSLVKKNPKLESEIPAIGQENGDKNLGVSIDLCKDEECKGNELKDEERNFDDDRVLSEKLHYDCDRKVDNLSPKLDSEIPAIAEKSGHTNLDISVHLSRNEDCTPKFTELVDSKCEPSNGVLLDLIGKIDTENRENDSRPLNVPPKDSCSLTPRNDLSLNGENFGEFKKEGDSSKSALVNSFDLNLLVNPEIINVSDESPMEQIEEPKGISVNEQEIQVNVDNQVVQKRKDFGIDKKIPIINLEDDSQEERRMHDFVETKTENSLAQPKHEIKASVANINAQGFHSGDDSTVWRLKKSH